jgi:hypothetical protein
MNARAQTKVSVSYLFAQMSASEGGDGNMSETERTKEGDNRSMRAGGRQTRGST